MNEVYLPQVWLRRVTCDPRSMTNRHALMRITFNTEAREETDGSLRRLAERVRRTGRDADHRSDSRLRIQQ